MINTIKDPSSSGVLTAAGSLVEKGEELIGSYVDAVVSLQEYAPKDTLSQLNSLIGQSASKSKSMFEALAAFDVANDDEVIGEYKISDSGMMRLLADMVQLKSPDALSLEDVTRLGGTNEAPLKYA